MAELPKYTGISSQLSRWKPLRRVKPAARWLWISLYTSREALAALPGLFPGTLYTISDAAGLDSLNEASNLMEQLVEAKLSQWDVENELIRLTELPDHLARAHTDHAIKGWWSRFRNIPQCALRDSHIPTLWNLIAAGTVNDKMREMWKTTFGTIVPPEALPSFLLPSSSDTGTAVQPSLFGDSRASMISRSKEINDLNPEGIHGPMVPGGIRSRSGSRSGFQGEENGIGSIVGGDRDRDEEVRPVDQTSNVVDIATERQNALREVLEEQNMLALIGSAKPPARAEAALASGSMASGKVIPIGSAMTARAAVAERDTNPENDPTPEAG